jgi:hypothetical protein
MSGSLKELYYFAMHFRRDKYFSIDDSDHSLIFSANLSKQCYKEGSFLK